jgi:hypothetical protein
MEDVFFEPSFQKFRDVVGLTSLEKIGNKIFGKHRWEADNIFVTADVEEILQAHTQPHLVSAPVTRFGSILFMRI